MVKNARRVLNGIGSDKIYLREQPNHHPNMVRRVEDLIAGEVYQEAVAIQERFSRQFDKELLTFIALTRDGLWARFSVDGKYEQEKSLMDYAILPYEEGWNRRNYLIRVDKGTNKVDERKD
jgi:hypothetical protein